MNQIPELVNFLNLLKLAAAVVIPLDATQTFVKRQGSLSNDRCLPENNIRLIIFN